MAAGSLEAVVVHARRLAVSASHPTIADSRLLQAFVDNGDSAAFATLVVRHGRLVPFVCRQVLRNQEDVEDAFQATFLVLALKAGSIHCPKSLSSWLYGVAYKTATNAYRAAARRHKHEKVPRSQPQIQPDIEVAARELQAIVAEEMGRLAEKHRPGARQPGRPSRAGLRVGVRCEWQPIDLW